MKERLKKGDWVVMHTCGEAEFPSNYSKLWQCKTDEYTQGEGVYKQNLVFLEGYSGCFMTDYLQKVDLSEMNATIQGLKKDKRLRNTLHNEQSARSSEYYNEVIRLQKVLKDIVDTPIIGSAALAMKNMAYDALEVKL